MLTDGCKKVILGKEVKMELTLRIPKEIDRALKIPRKEKESFLLKELAISLYQRDILSFGKARELANMSKWEFHNELGRRKIARHYTVEEFKEDLCYGEE
jgi:predicted HTH domain antitoxin